MASLLWDGAQRGERSTGQPPIAFVNFIQNHDQTGHRAFNERLTALAPERAVEALTVVLLLAPQIPPIFMGEERGETRPFTFFSDFHGHLAPAVPEGRPQEFRTFPRSEEHTSNPKSILRNTSSLFRL